VLDVIYVFVMLVFFAMMVGYVAACARLGRTADADRAGGP
jgi:hypothetical protein